ncbi:MAG: Z1 domain-containing protein [Nitrospiraceae bacterium]
MPINQSGAFYPIFTDNAAIYGPADRDCIKQTVERLLTIETNASQPGMLLGKIQSGKTKTFLGAIALAFDNGFDIAVILTKGTKALARQTLERVRRDFARFTSQDQLQIFDIMTIPTGLTGYELSQKLVFVAKKQVDNLDRLAKLFQETYPQLAVRRVLIIDDEADYASIGFRSTKEEGIVINRTSRQIDALRQVLGNSAFLQVTATPYSLYLQPQDLALNGVEFKPVRPAFTELVPVNDLYIGSDYYFDRSQEQNTVASFVYRPVTLEELEILRQEDRRRFRLEECLTSGAITSLRRAICNFVVGGCLRRLQDQQAGQSPRKFSFLFHTESAKAAHAWQERVVAALNQQLMDAVIARPDLLRQLLTESYNDLANSVQILSRYLPSLDEVILQAFAALEEGWLMVTKVNSEQQVEELLDREGQLRLRTPLNIFIGGQILDRGITLANLIGFFYGRRPQIYQQDTVLQHSRMFGFRPIEDLAVTRFYTEPAIHSAMRRMHESDVALRETIQSNPDRAVVFIQRDPRGQIVPCSPNKILISNTTTLRPFKRILPVGFQTDVRTRVQPIVRQIDAILDQALAGQNPTEPFEVSLAFALDLLRKVEPTLIMETELGYEFDWEAAQAALEYMSGSSTDSNNRGKVWCLVRRDRNLKRFQPELGPPYFSDSPDTAQREGAIARQVAIDIPMLMMIRQNGTEEHGWRGTPFYWPVIMAQQRIPVSIFAHQTTP